MKGLLVSLVGLIGLTALPVSVAAQTASLDRNGSPARMPDGASGDTLHNEEARGVLDEYAACLVKRRKLATLKALGEVSGSIDQKRALLKIVSNHCIYQADLTAPLNYLRGSLYRALAQKDFGDDSVEFLADPVAYAADAATTDERAAKLEAKYLAFASCVVRDSPLLARQLVNAKAASEAEAKAIASLYPGFEPCVSPEDRLILPRPRLVSLICEAYYREAAAFKSGGAS